MMAQRIQLSRRAGSNLQEASRALNGLPAIKIDRATNFGNPFTVGDVFTAEASVACFRDLLTVPVALNRAIGPLVTLGAVDKRTLIAGLRARQTALLSFMDDLHGHNLACWCKPGAPCHGDVLLDLIRERADGAA